MLYTRKLILLRSIPKAVTRSVANSNWLLTTHRELTAFTVFLLLCIILWLEQNKRLVRRQEGKGKGQRAPKGWC